ncbi:MAG: SCO family protein [Pirellulaceae bacterium]|nr:SCO family protein [Pirellulaceae bacterium]
MFHHFYLSKKTAVKAIACLLVGFVMGAEVVSTDAYGQFHPKERINKNLVPQRPGSIKEIQGVEVEKHPDAALGLDLEFANEEGQRVRLGSVFNKGRPVILSFNYSSCPKLCSQQLNRGFKVLNQTDKRAGQDFEFLSISIDPRETPQIAKQTRDKYVSQYVSKPENEDSPGEETKELSKAHTKGWNFWVGDQEAISRLAETVGFNYYYDVQSDEYNHPAVFILCTQEGRVYKYLNGLNYDPGTFKQLIVETSNGTVGGFFDTYVIPLCWTYDPERSKYTPLATRIMSVTAGFTVVLMLAFLAPYWLKKPPQPKGDFKVGRESDSSFNPPPKQN